MYESAELAFAPCIYYIHNSSRLVIGIVIGEIKGTTLKCCYFLQCLLIGELCSTLDIHQTWARNGSSSPEDLPPPLMDVASQPPSSLTVQQPQQAYSASMHGLTEQKQMRFNVNDIHTQPRYVLYVVAVSCFSVSVTKI